MKLTSLPTLIDDARLSNLIKYSTYASRLPEGAVCEMGVYRGGSLELLAKLFSDKTAIYGIDSFQGLPEPSKYDFHNAEDFSDVDAHGVVGYFKMLYPNVRILKGFAPEVFYFFNGTVNFRMVHIDADLYQSVLDSLNFFMPRMVTGGVVIIDDFNWSSTPGCAAAIAEYFSKTENEVSHRQELKYFDTPSSESNYQYLIVK